jgi:hypothetical protein
MEARQNNPLQAEKPLRRGALRAVLFRDIVTSLENRRLRLGRMNGNEDFEIGSKDWRSIFDGERY